MSTAADKYGDIIHLPHHTSPTRPRMAMIDRAAQFSPFAALTGHAAAIAETARLTGERLELEDSARAELDGKLRLVMELIEERPLLTVTYFEPDGKKAGGEYVTVTGRARRVDPYGGALVLADGAAIPLEDIRNIDGDVFGRM